MFVNYPPPKGSGFPPMANERILFMKKRKYTTYHSYIRWDSPAAFKRQYCKKTLGDIKIFSVMLLCLMAYGIYYFLCYLPFLRPVSHSVDSTISAIAFFAVFITGLTIKIVTLFSEIKHTQPPEEILLYQTGSVLYTLTENPLPFSPADLKSLKTFPFPDGITYEDICNSQFYREMINKIHYCRCFNNTKPELVNQYIAAAREIIINECSEKNYAFFS